MEGKQLAYRPDIDGLRALAVILVLLFHFELGVNGGFIGVDVFFVISGYLITEVIIKSIRSGRFSFHDFYVRRLLRLHPALLVTVAATLGAGYLIMDPASFSGLAESAKYATFSASNFYFWLNQGYFDAASQTQPLLHTWSLAAEWQFYLVWPFIVWISLKFSAKFLPWILAALTIASLVAAQVMLSYDSSAAYLMMPFRVFELAIGALLVFLPRDRLKPAIESAIALAGLVAIIAPAFYLTPETAFPGVAALLPCLGAAACIYGGRSTAGAALRFRPMVFIGLISYSIYLVHWPLFVFYKYYIFRDLNAPEKLTLLAISLITGWILYRLIEKILISQKSSIKLLGAASTVCLAIIIYSYSTSIIAHNGLPERVPKDYLKMAVDPVNFHKENYGGHGYNLNPKLGDKSGRLVAIIGGDSFALQYASGIDQEMSKKGEYIEGVFQHGCVISGEFTRVLNNVPRKDCRETYNTILTKLKGNNVPFIYAQSWGGYKNKIADSSGKLVISKTDAEYSEILITLLNGIRSDIGNRPLIIVGSQPYLSMDKSATSCLLRPTFIVQGCESRMRYHLDQTYSFAIRQVLKGFAESHANTYYIDAFEVLCPKGECSTISAGKILYSDATHLSKDGSQLAARTIVEAAELLK
jgi:peptidoglycan/LPS O-acetylase OafA/YrhL